MSNESSSVNITLAYILWGLGFLGLCGLHRLYLGKPVSGLIWLLTFGGFFVGQIIDLFLITGMIQEKNKHLKGESQTDLPLLLTDSERNFLQKISPASQSEQKLVQPIHKLLKAAKDNGNILSLGQAIMATGLPADKVQELLTDALRKDLAHIDNDLDSGAVRYHFDI